MKVMFSKSGDGRLWSWRAEPPRRRAFQGSTMASGAARADLPHDLAQLVVEASLGLEHGFWNLLANGASFKSVGRRRTRPGPGPDRGSHPSALPDREVGGAPG